MSSNNDTATIPMTEINPNDVTGMETSGQKTLSEKFVLSFHNISYQETVQSGFAFCKKSSKIEKLSDISGIMKPGLNAIIGPQDGSRSLLLDVLAARKDPRGLSGDILINGKPRPANFKCTSGYVPQKDVVMHTVTVRENVEFSAALRLPMSMPRDEKSRRINEVLELLHLDEESNVKPRSKKLLKRTSIAMELVAEHPILFLDDPTTVLDMITAIDIILVLRRMSTRGQTIIFSINQPPYSIFRYFDSVTLVASGKLILHGPAHKALEYFASTGYAGGYRGKRLDFMTPVFCLPLLFRVRSNDDIFFIGLNYVFLNHPGNFLLDIITGGFSAILDTEEDDHEANNHKELSERQHQVTEQLANMYVQSSLYKEVRTELDPLLGEQKAGRSSALEEVTCVTPFWHQLWWIICRSFKNFLDFSWFTTIQAINSVMVAIIVGTIFHFLQDDCIEVQRRASLLFSLTVFQCVISMYPRNLFVIDRNRFLHEHTSGYYRVSSYFLGKFLAELVPRVLLPSIIFTVVVVSIAGIIKDLKRFFTMLFTIMILAYSASSLLLSIGTRNNKVTTPTVLMTTYFVFMLFFSALEIYSGSLLPGLSPIQYINIPHYGFTALLHNEFLGQNFCPEHKTAKISSCENYVICTGEEFLMIQGIDLSPWGFWQNHVALVCIMIIFLSITYVRLSAQNKVKVLKSCWRKFQQLF